MGSPVTPSQGVFLGRHLTEWGLPREVQGGRGGQGHSRSPHLPASPRVPGPTDLHIQGPGCSCLTPWEPQESRQHWWPRDPFLGVLGLPRACWGVRPRGLNPALSCRLQGRAQGEGWGSAWARTPEAQRGRHSPARWAPREQQGSRSPARPGTPLATPALHLEGVTCLLEPQFPLPSGR